ncbi:MAG: response regulator [Anaerolineae bacterium]|nr:response regulator [Anaerolineae bacterium]
MPTWMIVEDEADIYEVLVAMFELWGIDHIHFFSGQEAIRWVDEVDSGRAEGPLPELAVLDIRLPDVDGDQVSARLRHSPRLGNIGIVMITAYRLRPAEEERIMAISGADKLLYKPLPVVYELRALFDQVLAARQRAPRQ